MVLNSRKCHFRCLGQNKVNETFVCNKHTEMKNSKEEKMLAVIIDNELRLCKQSFVKNVC